MTYLETPDTYILDSKCIIIQKCKFHQIMPTFSILYLTETISKVNAIVNALYERKIYIRYNLHLVSLYKITLHQTLCA